MISAFVDTSVLLHAVGGDHPQRAAARKLLGRASADLTLHVGAESIQEFVFHRLRIGDRDDAVRLGRLLLDAVVIHPFDAAVARRALEIIASSRAGGRDAVLAATALEAGFTEIVTHDSRFVVSGGLRVISADEFLLAHPA